MDQLAAREITVEVIYATAEQQRCVVLNVLPQSPAREVARASGLQDCFLELDIDSAPLGVWGEVVSDDHPLADGDRLEIYRPLENDPREARMRLAREGRTMGRADRLG